MNVEKIFSQNSISFHYKSPEKTRNRGAYFKIIMAIYDKIISNIILNGDKLKIFPLNSGTPQMCLVPPLLLSMVLKFLAKATR
jgi:hypothetical protein